VDRDEADFARDRAERFAGDRDASADLGLGYRDFGEGYGVRGAADAPRRNRWQREPTTARDVMTRNPKVVVRTAGIVEIARIMREENTGVVPVVDERGALAGLVTDRDIVIRTLSEGRNPIEVRAEDVMTDDVEAVTPDESLRDVVDLMGDKQIRRVPVVDRDDRLVGIISMADVATRADFDEDLQDALEEISARRSFWSRLFG
jgi:CBS domain-containing protein